MIDGMDNNDAWLRGPVLDPLPTRSNRSASRPSTSRPMRGTLPGQRWTFSRDPDHPVARRWVRLPAEFRSRFQELLRWLRQARRNSDQFGGAWAVRFCAGTGSSFWIPISSAPATASPSFQRPDERSEGRQLRRDTDLRSVNHRPGGLHSIRTLALPGNSIPSSRISPQARALIALYPDPNLPGAADNFLFTPSAISNGERFGFRTDKTLSSATRCLRASTTSGSTTCRPVPCRPVATIPRSTPMTRIFI